MTNRYLYAEALQTQTRIADMRTRLATMATYRALAYGLTDDEAALLAEAATMIGRVSERLYRDLVLAEPLAPGRCSCGADAYCSDYLNNGYHKGQPSEAWA